MHKPDSQNTRHQIITRKDIKLLLRKYMCTINRQLFTPYNSGIRVLSCAEYYKFIEHMSNTIFYDLGYMLIDANNHGSSICLLRAFYKKYEL